MVDQCGSCVIKGNWKKCVSQPCSEHNRSWYVIELNKRLASHIAQQQALRSPENSPPAQICPKCGGDKVYPNRHGAMIECENCNGTGKPRKA